MAHTASLTAAPLPELPHLPTPVYLRAQQLQAGECFALHEHPWHQFVYATAGSLVLQMEHSRTLITPLQGIWLPAGIRHASGTQQGAAFRSLYIDPAVAMHLPLTCQMYSITPLLRELIRELRHTAQEQGCERYHQHLQQLVVEHLHRLTPMNLYLAWPRTPHLQTLCKALYQDPADPLSVEDWGKRLGASSRTLTRRFEREVGMTLRDWRMRLRLFKAMEWLEEGRPITRIALDLGYASPSAFTYMFRCNLGCSPRQWLGKASQFKRLINTAP